MATLHLKAVWINLMSSGEYVAAPSADRKRDLSAEGEVRTYGAGRRRAITSIGRRNTMAFTLRRLTSAQVQRLEQWIGLEVMYRDYRGQRFVGVYFELSYREYKTEVDRYDISLTLTETTWVDGPVELAPLPGEIVVT
ncbi:hypothetical protein [Micromonospora wenchangensis]|uniref:hypothetical protein n=1 Tax=Micromonospora wenchangensis TaxID=1185415 RepID=UPI0037F49684